MKPILFVNLKNYKNKMTAKFEHAKVYEASDVPAYNGDEMYFPLSLIEAAFEVVAKEKGKTARDILGVQERD